MTKDCWPRCPTWRAMILRQKCANRRVKRLSDFYHLMRIAHEDEDDNVRDHAYRAYRAMLAGSHQHRISLEERLEVVPRLDDEAMIEFLAKQADDAQVRRAAIEKIRKQGFLGDIAINDPEMAVRHFAIGRIEQRSTLERVAQALRKKDKTAYRMIQQQLASEGGGDGAVGLEELQGLCEQIEILSRSGMPADEKRSKLKTASEQWAGYPQDLRAPLEQRFDGACRIVRKTIDSIPAEENDESPEVRALRVEFDGALDDAHGISDKSGLRQIEPLIERLHHLSKPVEKQFGTNANRRLRAARERLEQIRENLLAEQPVDPRLLSLCEEIEKLGADRVTPRKLGTIQERWDAAWKKVLHATPNDQAVAERFGTRMEGLENRLAAREEARQAALDQIEPCVEELEARIEDGDLSAAAKVQQQLHDLEATIGRHPKLADTDFKTRTHTARGRLSELREWQHWANNKVRDRLCREAEGLLESGLHPDAVIEKIKTLRGQWRDLNESERLPGDHPKRLPAPGLYRRFQAACDKAFKPAKGFFEKRDEVRNAHFEKLDELASRIEAAVADRENKDWKQLERLVRDGRRSLRELHNIPPKRRGPMSRRLREGAQSLDDRLEEQYQVVERRKKRIIEEVAKLDPAADLEAAVAAAKDAQRRWKEAGSTRRRTENKLWKELRAVSDPIFDHLSGERKQQKAEEAAHYAALDELLERAADLQQLAEETPEDARIELQKLRDQWRQEKTHDRNRERTFTDRCRSVESSIRSAELTRENQQRVLARELVDQCISLEARWVWTEG